VKIVHVTVGKANPERMNGVNKVVDAVARELLARNKDVEVWGITPTPEEKTMIRSYPLKLFRFSSNPFYLNKRIKNAIDDLPEQTIVHFHGVFAPPYYRMARLLKRRNIPWIIAPHGALLSASLSRRAIIKRPYLRFFDDFILSHAKFRHAITKAEQQSLRPWGKSIIIPNAGIPQSYSGKTVKDIIFGYVGRLDARHKGLDLLIDGFIQYVQAGGEGVLWLVGDGPDKKFLQNKVSPAQVPVHFWGAQFGAGKEDLIRQMTVFIHTSRWDVMPTAVLEAAALGKPLVLSSETGMAEMNEKWQSGVNLCQNTSGDIARALKDCEDLQVSGKLDVMGRQAAAMIENELNWKNSVTFLTQHFYQT
jgi:glycosyltransferase involved in cell wall biosynthesis